MKPAIIIAIGILLLAALANAADTPPPQPTNLNTDTNKLIIEENAKVKAELKTYIDRKTLDTENNLQATVNENFLQLDSRMISYGRKLALQIGVIIITSIILGGTLNLLIKRKVEKKRILQRRIIDEATDETVDLPLATVQNLKNYDYDPDTETVTNKKQATAKPTPPPATPPEPTPPRKTLNSLGETA